LAYNSLLASIIVSFARLITGSSEDSSTSLDVRQAWTIEGREGADSDNVGEEGRLPLVLISGLELDGLKISGTETLKDKFETT
jgi:hypothetical protein